MYILLRPNEHKSGKGMPDLTIIVLLCQNGKENFFFLKI